jgi:hypothetical protein
VTRLLSYNNRGKSWQLGWGSQQPDRARVDEGQHDAQLAQLLQLPDPIVVASFMRSGTHLALDFLRRNFSDIGAAKLPLEANDNVYLPIDCLIDGSWSDQRINRVITRSGTTLCKTHWCDPEFKRIVDSPHRAIGEWLQRRARVVLVHRDPRETLDSLIVWHYANGNLGEPAVPSSDWLRARLAEWRTTLRSWSGTSRPVYRLSFDRIVATPDRVGRELGRFLGRSPNTPSCTLPSKLKGKWQSRVNRIFATNPPSTEILTMRPNPEVRWTPEQVEILRREVSEFVAQVSGTPPTAILRD